MPLPTPRGQYFRRHHPAVRLGWDLVDSGLRRAQLGAAWALSAHSTVSRDPALIVLPTGVGKTLVLCLAPFLLRARRALVVTPGKLVRAQVADAFETLADLKQAGVLASDVPPPRVARVEHRATSDDWREWRDVDVVVGTPNVLSDGFPDVERVPRGMFDLVIFDEAHHLPAQVWTAILEAVDASAVLLTATPTRRDGKPLAGDLIYSYPLATAIADGVYAPVRFVPVEWDEGEDANRVLAQAAARRLADPVHTQAGSRLIVRTATQVEARALVDVYAEVGVPVGLVLADTSQRTVRRTLRDVRDGKLQGFVAVGALIEGFDFPTLKVAAYHHPHRSLAPTLQFLGRLSRVTEPGVRGELLAIPEHVEGETRELYRQDRDWAELMPEIVDAAEREERAIRRYVADAQVTGPFDLPPRALTPPRSSRIYRLDAETRPALDVDPTRIGRADVVFRLFDAPTSLVAFVTHRVVGPRWAETHLLDVPEFALHLATWVEPQRALFVSTESGPALEDLLDAFGVRAAVRNLAPEDLVRLVYAADPGNYFSVGLRAAQARRARGATYDMTAGPAVESALDYTDRASSVLGHLMARPKAGNRGTLGFSVAKSKLWEPENAASLLDFRRWAEQRAAELDVPALTVGLPGLDVQLGQQIEVFPAGVLSASLSPEIVLGQQIVLSSGTPVRVADLDVLVRREGDDALEITLAVADEAVWRGLQSPSGLVIDVEHGEVDVLMAQTGELVAVSTALREAPLAVYLTDGSTLIGDVWLPARRDVGSVRPEVLLTDPWREVDIANEVGSDASVQARTARIASETAPWVATDHGSGELADFISLTVGADHAGVRFYHCKGSGGSRPGRRVDDLYEVLGQCVKSIPWTLDPVALWTELERRLDARAAFRLVHGDESSFRAALAHLRSERSTTVEIDVVAVQPGISISDVDGWPIGRALLHAAEGWCAAENVRFRLLGSP